MEKVKQWLQNQKTMKSIAAWTVAGIGFYIIKDLNIAELLGLSKAQKITFQSSDFGSTTQESKIEDKKE